MSYWRTRAVFPKGGHTKIRAFKKISVNYQYQWFYRRKQGIKFKVKVTFVEILSLSV